MRKPVARALVVLLTAAWLLEGLALRASAQNASADEKESCIKNLKLIYEAIQAYQTEHKDMPNWLSDLVPKYLSDANVLVCPVCRRTGQVESPPLADPNIPSSYLFEFCPVPLGKEAPAAPNRTRRDWKRRQMGMVGSIVPVVRCRHHEPVLNLGFDGRIYESTPAWESMLTNRINPEELSIGRLFANEHPTEKLPQQGPITKVYPPRDSKARKQLLDLGSFYNAMLTESWHGNTGNDLGALPVGLQTIGGIEFDVRGIVQLAGKSAASARFPREVKGIKVRQKCQRLHFLHATGYGKVPDEATRIGSYVLHFATNQMTLEVQIVYGDDVRDWHALGGEPKPGKNLKVIWEGENAISKAENHKLRLFLTTWENLAPGIEIDWIDYVSAMANPAPFLIAITAD
jgi:hypothetical protein